MALIPSDAVAIGVGAALGALSRYQAGRMAAEFIATDPNKFSKLSGWHTCGINIGGSFLLGGISASPVVVPKSTISSLQPPPPPPNGITPPSPTRIIQGMSPRSKLMFGVGFCGSFTTFSTYSVDAVTWLSQGNYNKALSYIAANNFGSLVAAAGGMILVKKFFG